MNTQIFLIAPQNADIETFPAQLGEAIDATYVSALLLTRGKRSEEEYEELARAILPIAQDAGCAVLLDNMPALAKSIGADGVHITSGINAFREALEMLKPDMIVGAGELHSRHDAMTKAEAGADYMFFGPIEGQGDRDPTAREEARWWSETFEVPAVYSNPDATLDDVDAEGCEFVAIAPSTWLTAEGPAATLSAIAETLEDAE
ncbi:thiamine phosphate synthase [Mariluticola halotolerans]|uniref:thiamine phosphate synthase n=1 Tax=Mariluticola halotolerans TaxID=2909283 RepID=UPI0026E181D9|nr:thiamine phosphate synthase [Mariluticola halotolerans]UJQ94039.1 thiamine phosphate synthase [Mariluticola halotolerans]